MTDNCCTEQASEAGSLSPPHVAHTAGSGDGHPHDAPTAHPGLRPVSSQLVISSLCPEAVELSVLATSFLTRPVSAVLTVQNPCRTPPQTSESR